MIHQTLTLKPNLKNVYSSQSQAPRPKAYVSDSVSVGGVPKRRNQPSIESKSVKLTETDPSARIDQFNTIAATPSDQKHRSLNDKGIIIKVEKPGERNNFRVRKYSRSGSVSDRGDSEVRIADTEQLERLKQSIESDDEGDSVKKIVGSLERGLH
jgi:hypothetical protein